MFSGIVEAIGEIRHVEETSGGRRFSVASPFVDLSVGESICVSGVCLTVTTVDPGIFTADVSAETLRRSKLGQLSSRGSVNLERSLRLGDRLSGHLVFGHVDGVGRLEEIVPEGESALYRFSAPADLSRYLIEKGSIAVDGVSLTVFDCRGPSFRVAVIPQTAKATTLGLTAPGSPVNLESDMIARYVEKLLASRASSV